MAYFNYQGKSCFYSESGQGQPLVILHGNTASSKMFLEVAPKYTEHYKVILIDFLGHGQSDRLDVFPADLWFDEAQQVITFLKEKQYTNANLIGCSGGALVAINVALEAPELVNKIIADSFEGEKSIKAFTDNIVAEREASKQDEGARMFYQYMNGDSWENVVDNDTSAIVRHSNELGKFFHKELVNLKSDILLTGSKQDEFILSVSPDFFEKTYGDMLKKIGHGTMHLLETGGHPAMLTNQQEFYEISISFLGK